MQLHSFSQMATQSSTSNNSTSPIISNDASTPIIGSNSNIAHSTNSEKIQPATALSKKQIYVEQRANLEQIFQEMNKNKENDVVQYIKWLGRLCDFQAWDALPHNEMMVIRFLIGKALSQVRDEHPQFFDKVSIMVTLMSVDDPDNEEEQSQSKPKSQSKRGRKKQKQQQKKHI